MISRNQPRLATVMAVMAAILITLGSILTSTAHDYDAGKLTITHPWARPTLGNVMIGAVYVVISNDGETDDRLTSATSTVAERVEIHETIKDGDIAKMQPVQGGVVIPADDSAVLEPLGKHIMLIGLKKKLVAGETLPLTLVFEKHGKIDISVRIEKPAGGAAPKGSHKGSHQ